MIDNDHYLLVDIHHIIMDGISTPIFLKKLLLAYQGTNISQDKWTYPDYAYWLHESKNNNLDNQIQYWTDHFTTITTVI